ncbi:MAG: nucleotidyltransferase domain-containing protein [Hyphomicrobiaceae bacterium]
MIDEAQRAHILKRLRVAEAEEGVRILFAAESGSRAWGFASPDSDYDVRFVYAHSLNWYLKLVAGRDVIERPLDERLVDLAGWDARKALQLLLKSNPALYEWLSSPFIYIDDGRFRPAARSLFERHASQRTLAFHYASIAGSSRARHLAGREDVNLKRYFYVIRPVLALAWVVAKGTAPPMSITDLLADSQVPDAVRAAILELIELKRTTPELGSGPRIGVLDAWIDQELATLDPARLDLRDHDQGPTSEEADGLLRSTIGAP